MSKLFPSAVTIILVGVIVSGVTLFLPAGTLTFWQAWVLVLVVTGSASAIGVYLALTDPVLLARRTRVGPAAERSPVQRIIMTLNLLGVVGLLILCGLDYRFGWSPVPPSVSVAGDALVVLGFLINFLALRVNRYGGSTVEVVPGQTVVSTGPYKLVRHPMYAGVVLILIGIPLALGSWWGLAIMVLMTPVLLWRILDEERLLAHDLLGYVAYMRSVRYRLVPFLW